MKVCNLMTKLRVDFFAIHYFFVIDIKVFCYSTPETLWCIWTVCELNTTCSTTSFVWKIQNDRAQAIVPLSPGGNRRERRGKKWKNCLASVRAWKIKTLDWSNYTRWNNNSRVTRNCQASLIFQVYTWCWDRSKKAVRRRAKSLS